MTQDSGNADYEGRLDDDEPRFEVVDEPDDVHYTEPDEPSVGREFYVEPTAPEA